MFWRLRGDFDVESLLPIIVQIVTGILGGQAVGAVLQQVAMSHLTKIISGAAGGVAGGTPGAQAVPRNRRGDWVFATASVNRTKAHPRRRKSL
jgi:hypothetical protein